MFFWGFLCEKTKKPKKPKTPKKPILRDSFGEPDPWEESRRIGFFGFFGFFGFLGFLGFFWFLEDFCARKPKKKQS